MRSLDHSPTGTDEENPLTIEALHHYAEMICTTYFGIAFKGTIRWSMHLKKKVGTFDFDTNEIELNFKYYKVYGEKEILNVLRHELCHYYCNRLIGYHEEENELLQSLLFGVKASQSAMAYIDQLESKRCGSCRTKTTHLRSTTECVSCSYRKHNREVKRASA